MKLLCRARGVLAAACLLGGACLTAEDRPIQATLKALPSDKGEWGIDWKASFARALVREGRAPASENLQVYLESTGLVALNEKDNVHNSVQASFGLKGAPWKFAESAATAAPRTADIGNVSLADLQGVAAYKATYLFPKLDAVFESTQSLRHFNAGVGASLALRTPALAPVLDFLPALLRYGAGSDRNNARALDLSVGYRYLRQNYVSPLFPKHDDPINRADLNVEWETGIFSGQRLVVRYNGYYLLSAEPRKYVDFVVVRVDLLKFPSAAGDGAVSLKYTAGQLPPLYQTGTSLGGGVSIDF